jgi:hypothetical protein
MKPWVRTAGAIALWVFFGCEILDPGSEGPGYLGDTGIPIAISVPDTVQSGVPFAVAIPVYGSGSCTIIERVEVRVAGHLASVRPRVRTKGGVCTDDLHRFIAGCRVTFAVRGPAALNVIGRYGTLDETGRSITRDTVITEQLFVE